MRLRLVLALVLAVPLVAAGCGVKSDLIMPNGKETPKNQKDPSKPPNPNGQ
jgi:hypothetical protein